MTEVRKIIDFDEEEEEKKEEVVEEEGNTGKEKEETDVRKGSENDGETETGKVNDQGRPKQNRKPPERYGEYVVYYISQLDLRILYYN